MGLSCALPMQSAYTVYFWDLLMAQSEHPLIVSSGSGLDLHNN